MPGVQTRWVITMMMMTVMIMIMMIMMMVVVRLVFMLGTTTETRLQEEILQESRDHGDIVQVQEMSSSLHHCFHAFFPGQLSGHLQEPHIQECDGSSLGHVRGIF